MYNLSNKKNVLEIGLQIVSNFRV